MQGQSSPSRTVVIVPGIMGSELTYDGGETIWSSDFVRNYHTMLSEPSSLVWFGRRARAVLLDGIRLTRFLPVTLSLWGSVTEKLDELGYTVISFGYDWRGPLEDTAAEFAAWLRATAAPPYSLVTHSMGGLVARIALGSGQLELNEVHRIVHVGSPLSGSPAAFGSLTGKAILPLADEARHAMYLWRADQYESALRKAIRTFPSVYQLLPHAGHGYIRLNAVDSFNPLDHDVFTAEQKDLMRSAQEALTRAERLLEPTGRTFSIYTQKHASKATDLEYLVRVVEDSERSYEIRKRAIQTDEGDGTVPAGFAKLPSTREFAINDTTHAWMCASRYVARLVGIALGEE